MFDEGILVEDEFQLPFSSSSSSSSSSQNCNLPIITLENSYPNENRILKLEDIPILYKGFSTRNAPLSDVTTIEQLIKNYGSINVTLSSSNTYSHDKITMTLQQYLNTMNTHHSTSVPSSSSSSINSNETYYLFGNNYNDVWNLFTNLYHLPPCNYCSSAGAVTIGVGGKYSGVSFHYHGPGYSEIIHGSKLFFLFPPSLPPSQYGFHPNMTQYQWYHQIYPQILQNSNIFYCEIYPGDILYFPDQWYHGTLNMRDYNFFVSVFIDKQLIK